MTTLFLAAVDVSINKYMVDDSEHETKLHIVQADDSSAAYQAVEAHYEAMSDNYGTSYFVSSIEITEMIVAKPLSATEESA